MVLGAWDQSPSLWGGDDEDGGDVGNGDGGKGINSGRTFRMARSLLHPASRRAPRQQLPCTDLESQVTCVGATVSKLGSPDQTLNWPDFTPFPSSSAASHSTAAGSWSGASPPEAPNPPRGAGLVPSPAGTSSAPKWSRKQIGSPPPGFLSAASHQPQLVCWDAGGLHYSSPWNIQAVGRRS